MTFAYDMISIRDENADILTMRMGKSRHHMSKIGSLSAPLGLQLLGDGPDVVRLDAAAAADVAHAQLVGRPGEPVHVPARVHARLHGGGELGESLVPGIGISCNNLLWRK